MKCHRIKVHRTVSRRIQAPGDTLGERSPGTGLRPSGLARGFQPRRAGPAAEASTALAGARLRSFRVFLKGRAMIAYECANCLQTIETEDAVGLCNEKCPVCGHVNVVPMSRKQKKEEREARNAAMAAEKGRRRLGDDLAAREGRLGPLKDEAEGGTVEEDEQDGGGEEYHEGGSDFKKGSIPEIAEGLGAGGPGSRRDTGAAPLGRTEKCVLVACFPALIVVAFSVFLCWVRTDSEWRNVSGLKGDAKISSMITILALILLGVGTAKRTYLPSALLFCSCWGGLLSIWLLGFIWRVSVLFADISFLQDVRPGVGPYIGLLCALLATFGAAFLWIRIRGGGTRPLKTSVFLGAQGCSLVLGLIIAVLYFALPNTINMARTIGYWSQRGEDNLPGKGNVGTVLETFRVASVDVSEVYREYRFVRYSWKVEISNLLSVPIRVDIAFKMFDKNGFELNDNHLYDQFIPANSTKTTTETSMMEEGVYDRMKEYKAFVSLR